MSNLKLLISNRLRFENATTKKKNNSSETWKIKNLNFFLHFFIIFIYLFIFTITKFSTLQNKTNNVKFFFSLVLSFI